MTQVQHLAEEEKDCPVCHTMLWRCAGSSWRHRHKADADACTMKRGNLDLPVGVTRTVILIEESRNEAGHDCPAMLHGETCGGPILVPNLPMREAETVDAICGQCSRGYIIKRSDGDVILHSGRSIIAA